MTDAIALTAPPTEAAAPDQPAPDQPAPGPAGRGCCALSPDSLEMTEADAARLAAMFKAMGNPVRLQIVQMLSRYGGQACVCDVESLFDLSQPTISHHLKVLRQAGLIDSEQRGLWRYYFVRPAALRELQAWFGESLAAEGE